MVLAVLILCVAGCKDKPRPLKIEILDLEFTPENWAQIYNSKLFYNLDLILHGDFVYARPGQGAPLVISGREVELEMAMELFDPDVHEYYRQISVLEIIPGDWTDVADDDPLVPDGVEAQRCECAVEFRFFRQSMTVDDYVRGLVTFYRTGSGADTQLLAIYDQTESNEANNEVAWDIVRERILIPDPTR